MNTPFSQQRPLLFQKTYLKLGKKVSDIKNFAAKDKPNTVLFYGAILIMFVVIYILNFLQPYWWDEFVYSYKWHSPEKIKNFADILDFQHTHYLEWGGRIVVHTILQTLLLLGETCADLINSLMYVVFILSIYRIANIKSAKKYNLTLLVAVNLLVWFLQFSFGSAIVWLTGSCNYMWMATFALLFVYPACKFYLIGEVKMTAIKTFFYFFGGIIAGWSNETTSVICVVFIIILFFVLYREGKAIPLWAKVGFAGLLIGAAIMLLAPGNYVRFTFENGVPFYYRIPQSMYMLFYYFFRSGLPVTIVVALSFVVSRYFAEREAKRFHVLACLFVASAIIGLLSMIASPIFPSRAWFTIITFAIVAILILSVRLDFKQRFIATCTKTAIPLLVLLLSSQYFGAAKDLMQIRRAFDIHEQEIYEQKNKGKSDIILSAIQLDLQTDFVHPPYELMADSTALTNRIYATYYGVRTARLKDELPEQNNTRISQRQISKAETTR
ncbi:DUF3329 domain-containing protein [Viscerimonas tarda]